MKKILLNMKTVGLMAIVAGALTLNSCGNTAKCTEPKDDNYNSTTEECDEAATENKFAGNWTGTPGSYPFNVTASTTAGDYMINVSTNFGLTDANNNQLTPANLNGWSVSGNQATLSSATLYNGTLSNATMSYTNANSATVTYTLSGFGGSVDGTYTESLSK